jgi:citrate/tricarballylate utilization protein
MSALANLVEDARREAEAPHAEAARMVGICNSCRYCEGYCAAFQAMERRVAFDPPTLDYLANLCHQCGACLYACQYAPPHAFAVNIPRALAEVRVASYESHAWPRALGVLYRKQSALFAWGLSGGLAFFFALAIALGGRRALWGMPAREADFYAVFPHNVMVAIFGASFGFAVLAMVIGAIRFRRTLGAGGYAHLAAGHSAARLANLHGGGEGCYSKSGIVHPPSSARRVFHHFTFYGFLLCFASTSLATWQHYVMGWAAPYPMSSLVVILGTVGGMGLVAGPAGLLALRSTRDAALDDLSQSDLDRAFLWLLLLTSVSGLMLLALRSTPAMPAMLAIHLGCVLALFISLPYGKFVHGLYRYLALARHERERREPNPVGFGES